MPKMKSKSGAKKRFRLPGTGKAGRATAGARHNLTSKSKTRSTSRWVRTACESMPLK